MLKTLLPYNSRFFTQC